MSANTNNVKAQLEDQYARDQTDEQTADYIPPTLSLGCGY
jgi:hypothetical protein